MKYLLLVSHGDFSTGLRQELSMFAGDAIDSVIAVGLKPDESADKLGKRFEDMLENLKSDSQFIVLADIIGGSPLTTVCNVLSKEDLLEESLIIGGMNFSMALTALMSKDSEDILNLKSKILAEAVEAIKPLEFNEHKSDDDDDI